MEDAIQLEWSHHSHQDFILHLREVGNSIGDLFFEDYYCDRRVWHEICQLMASKPIGM